MEKIPVWIDCDTGVDDAVAIMLAHALEELSVVGLSATCGNQTLERTFRNTSRICRLIGADYHVFPGAEKPLLRPLENASMFHGQNGLGDVDFPLPEAPTKAMELPLDRVKLKSSTRGGSRTL